MDAAISTHCESGTDGFLILYRANRHGYDFISTARLSQAKRLFNSNLVKWVHCHFYIRQFDTTIVSFHTYLNVIVNHPFNRDQNLHVILLTVPNFSKPGCPVHCLKQIGPKKCLFLPRIFTRTPQNVGCAIIIQTPRKHKQMI